MKKYLFSLIGIFLLLGACSKDEMDRTIFIPDDDDINLPAYTEWGYNAFGAKYERDYFLVSDYLVPCKITYQNGQLNFSLIGNRKGSAASYRDAGKMTLTFSFSSSPMRRYADLVSLHDTTIVLTDASCAVKIEKDGAVTNITPQISGHLTFKRAQLLRIDDIDDRIILSGTFDVQFFINDMLETISDGRFDVGINKYFSSDER
jgi:hypothetical protein